MQAIRSKAKPLFFFALLVGMAMPCYSQAPSPEYQIKGAYILNFSRFIQWPENTSQGREDPFIISILGRDPFGVFLDELLRDEAKEGRPILVKRLKSLAEVEGSHILFITREADIDDMQLHAYIRDQNILTISDRAGFARKGGIVEFYVEDDNIKFEVNLKEGEGKGLQFSSKLLRLAKICCKEN